MLTSHVARRASRAQGRALIAAVTRAFDAEARLDELGATIRRGASPGHLAPTWGAASALLGLSRSDAREIHLHSVLRGVVSAAVRLGMIGPFEGQGIQRRASADVESVLAASEGRSASRAAQPVPWLDIVGARQDELYSRLFQS
jgi:urease accessory protein